MCAEDETQYADYDRNQPSEAIRETGKPFVDLDANEICRVIDELDLSCPRKHFLRSRWMKQVMWWEKRARDDRGWFLHLSIIALVASAATTALSGVNFAANSPIHIPMLTVAPIPVDVGYTITNDHIRGLIFISSLLVTISMGWLKLRKFDEVWLRKRRYAELLKIEGWRFFQLTDSYKDFGCHAKAYPEFARRVENIIEEEIQGYIGLFQGRSTAAPEDGK